MDRSAWPQNSRAIDYCEDHGDNVRAGGTAGVLQSAVNEWMDEERHSSPEFDPKLKLVTHRVAIMRVDRDASIGATAEAALRSKHGQQEQWHVTDWRQEGHIAHIKISGDGWAGSSSYWTGVQYLIRKSVARLPGIEKVVF